MSLTSTVEVACAVLFLTGLLPGLVLGFAAGRHRRGRFDRHVDQALAVAAPRPREGRPLSHRQRAEARRLIDEVFGEQREEA